jgi:hypothetical protein
LWRDDDRDESGLENSEKVRICLWLLPYARLLGVLELLEVPMEAVNREVLKAFKRDLLAPEVIDEAVRKALERLRPSDATEERRRALRTELVNIEQELVRLSAAIASGGELAALLDAVREREQRRRRLEADLMSLDSLVRVSVRCSCVCAHRASELEKISIPRPMTHNLIKNILESLDARVQKIVVNDLRDNTFYAVIHLRLGRADITVDSRPSDSIALALRVGAPIFVEEEVVHKARTVEVAKETEIGTGRGDDPPSSRSGSSR